MTATQSQPATSASPTRELASFLADLRFEDIPPDVARRAEDLFLDWLASALAGRGAQPVRALEAVAAKMGPADGPSEIVVSRRRTSPLFAALVNGAASHVVEQDDVHNGSVFHPGTVVWPAVLATAQQTGASGREVITAGVAGYEAGIRVGEALGRSHYRVFHTTGTAGTLAAAAGVAHVLGADASTMLHALGSAGTQAAGLWEFLRDAADSKQLHTAKAAADGLLAAYLAREGMTGATHIVEGAQGMVAGMSSDADVTRLVADLGSRWCLAETSFKFHASCRHTHPAADALLMLIQEEGVHADAIRHVRARVHQAAIDVLEPAARAETIHQAKFSMPFVLALIALRGHAGIDDFTAESLGDLAIRAFMPQVEMVLDTEVDVAYPARWIGVVEVETADGRTHRARVDVPKGDPGNTLTRDEIAAKAHQLAAFRDGATPAEMDALIARIWNLEHERDVGDLLQL